MKTKLILVLTVITFAFQACSSDDDNNDPMIEACDTPINLSISEITADSSTLNWLSPNDNQAVEVEYGLAGFSPGTGTIVSTSQNTLPISNLIPSTSYDFYVQAVCASDNRSQSGVASFTTAEISPYAGTWSGTFAGDDTGTWAFQLSVNGLLVSGAAFSNNDNSTSPFTSVVVTADGSVSSSLANGTTSEAQFTGETIDGTWINTSEGNISGTITGSRE